MIECGAGTAVPTVRLESEAAARQPGATLVRINVRDPAVPPGHLSIPLTVADATEQIETAIAAADGRTPHPGP